MQKLIVRELGKQDYQSVWQSMKTFTDTRDANTTDELWLLEHPPVFTQGQAGKPEHVLNPREIPVVQTDRGGQVTYHGPGQLVGYTLMDVERLGLSIRDFVTRIANAVIDVLQQYQIPSSYQTDAPGVYVDKAKICSIGLRVRKGYSYHGLAFNIDMDLEPFSRINPCGFSNLQMVQLRDLLDRNIDLKEIFPHLTRAVQQQLGYGEVINMS